MEHKEWRVELLLRDSISIIANHVTAFSWYAKSSMSRIKIVGLHMYIRQCQHVLDCKNFLWKNSTVMHPNNASKSTSFWNIHIKHLHRMTIQIIVSSWVSAPSWNIDLTSFYVTLSPSKKKKSKSARPLLPALYEFMRNPLTISENLTPPPWNIPSSKIGKTHFFKETKDFISNIK